MRKTQQSWHTNTQLILTAALCNKIIILNLLLFLYYSVL